MQTPTNINELEAFIAEHLPNASIEKDYNGQLVIYTGLQTSFDHFELEEFDLFQVEEEGDEAEPDDEI